MLLLAACASGGGSRPPTIAVAESGDMITPTYLFMPRDIPRTHTAIVVASLGARLHPER